MTSDDQSARVPSPETGGDSDALCWLLRTSVRKKEGVALVFFIFLAALVLYWWRAQEHFVYLQTCCFTASLPFSQHSPFSYHTHENWSRSMSIWS